MKLETENLILYPLTKSLIQQILNDEVTYYATEAIEALLEWTLTQDEVKSIIAKCHYKNIPSQSLLDKLGFKLIGEEDEMDLYQIKLEDNSFLSISKYVMTGIITECLIIPIAKVVKHIKKSK